MLKNINLDLSSISSNTISLVPDGIYNAKVTQAEQKNSISGNPMIAVTFNVSNGQGITSDIQEFMVLNSSFGLKRLKEMLITANFPNPDQLSSEQDLIGLEMQVVIVQKMQNYGLRSRIVQFLKKVEPISPEPNGSKSFDL